MPKEAWAMSDLSLIDFDLWKQMQKLKDLGWNTRKSFQFTINAPAKGNYDQCFEYNGAKVEQLCLDFTLPGYDDMKFWKAKFCGCNCCKSRKYVE